MGIKWMGDTSSNGLATPSERLVARYVHKSNSVLNIASVDVATGIFTTSNSIVGSYSVGQIISMIVNYPSIIPAKLFSEWNGINHYGLEYITPNTFYVVNRSSSNARVTYASGQNIDLTQFVFEYNLVGSVVIDTSLITFGNTIRSVVTCVRERPGYTEVRYNLSHDRGAFGLYQSLLDGRHFMIGYSEQILQYNPESGVLVLLEGRSAQRQWSGGTSWSYSASAGIGRTIDVYKNMKINSITCGFSMANGNTIEIFTR